MQTHHKLIAGGLVLFLAGWLSWTILLTRSEVAPPVAAPQGN